MNLSEIIKKNSILSDQLSSKEKLKIKVLSNITINQFKPSIEYYLKLEGLNARIDIGDYDNILQESNNVNKNETSIIIWELSNIKESFVYEIEKEDERYFNLFLEKIKNELKILFQNLSDNKLVIFNKFSHLLHSSKNIRKTKYQSFVENINFFLGQNAPDNFFLVETDKIISNLSCEKSIDNRGFYSNKSLYTFSFLNNYAKFISPVILSLHGKSKKALIFDCDNTLWKGIVGEDGVNNIKLSEKDQGGIFFKEIHLIAKKLSAEGVIVGICSKNNIQDVEDVFNLRKDFILNDDEIVIKKVNWQDKPTNLNNIAKELNIGIESLVFIDDSKFEINFVNELIPEITTYLVPERHYEYPALVNNITNLFFNLNLSDEDKKRTLMYKENQLREKDLLSFKSINTYLESLDINIELSNKNKSALERVVQMTQKTNQFNLTTKRYSTSDINNFYASYDYDVISLNVYDKYGPSGITGLCIVKYNKSDAIIDTFLLSCRILGRNIEITFLNQIINQITRKKVKNIYSTFIKTKKNSHLENFFDENGFILKTNINDIKNYRYNFDYQQNKIKYINATWKED
tara:strand:- start:292 stop:2019 length:1728 start_codon:yes stop_codon:yes gene_type:complete